MPSLISGPAVQAGQLELLSHDPYNRYHLTNFSVVATHFPTPKPDG